MKRKSTWITTGIIAATMLTTLRAEVPQLMNYQGRLLDNGALVTSNNVSITLSLYDAADGGATLLYQEQDTVNVVDGLYSTIIGDNPETVGVAHAVLNDAIAAGGASTFLGIALNGAAEFTPRAQILSTAFALQCNENDPAFTASPAAGITGTDTANWNEAHSWGNHADAGYVISGGAGDYLPRSGGTMLGDINMNSNVITDAIIMPAGDLTMGPFTQGAP